MKRATTLATVATGVLSAVMLFSPASDAADQPVAQNTKTVWVDGRGQSSFADKVNKTHAALEAEGWKFADLEIYTENGDMQGAFVTYVR